jgi:hypothetical protein
MSGGGRTKFTLVPPKNVWSKLGEVLPNLPVFIVTVRFVEVFKKALVPINVTESGMFMEIKLLQRSNA